MDAERNGEETDTDCGGSVCDPCANGRICLENRDCISDLCSVEGVCIPPPACTDGQKNGQETDIDCGGPICDPCEIAKHCLQGTDCASGFCDPAGLCAEPSCEDGQKNGEETDTDCGGNVCSPCTAGKACEQASDCTGGVCRDFICQAPSCGDHVQNGKETDIDCGGPDCPSCPNGAQCQTASDCYSFVCSGTCQAPTCADQTQNQYETDIDCGGPNCDPCAAGKQCITNDDCSTRYCDNGFCTAITSCKHLVSLFPNSPSGWYHITPATTTVQAFCYIVPPTVYTFYYINNGPATSKVADNDGCKEAGMMLFTPTTQSHYTIARDLALSWNLSTTGNFLGPLGIYNPHNGVDDSISTEKWCGTIVKQCCEKKMVGGGGDDTVSRSGCGFTSLANGQFWASEKTDISEPSGDYDATCWLLFRYESNGNVRDWNDNDCSFSYTNYMCMAIDDVP